MPELSSQVILDFQKAIESASQMEKAIREIDGAINSLDVRSKNAKKSISSLMADEVGRIKSLSTSMSVNAKDVEIKVDTKNLKNSFTQLNDRIQNSLDNVIKRINSTNVDTLKISNSVVKFNTGLNNLIGSTVKALDGISAIKSDDAGLQVKYRELVQKINTNILNIIKSVDNIITTGTIDTSTLKSALKKELSDNISKSLNFYLTNLEDHIIKSLGGSLAILKSSSAALERLPTTMSTFSANVKEVTNKFNTSTKDIKSSNKSLDALNKNTKTMKDSLNELSKKAINSIDVKDIRNIESKMGQLYNNMMDQMLKKMHTSLNNTVIQVPTRNIDPDVRRMLAAKQNMNVKDYVKANPHLTGDNGVRELLQANVDVINKRLHGFVVSSINDIIKKYKEQMQKTSTTPKMDISTYLTQRMASLQELIVNKVKQILTEQFKSLTKDIKSMKAMPLSLGYTPPQQVINRVQGGGGGHRFSRDKYQGDILESSIGYAPVLDNYKDLVKNINTNKGIIDKFQNTMRSAAMRTAAYTVIGAPTALMYQAFEATKEFDMNIKKAEQNLLAKGTEELQKLAEERVAITKSITYEEVKTAQYAGDVRKELSKLTGMASAEGIRPYLQGLAINTATTLQDTSQMYQIASRRMTNPYEALALTRSASTVIQTERGEITPTEAATGLEAVASQWKMSGYELGLATDMLLKTSRLSQVTTKELLQTQKGSGSLFYELMAPDREKYAKEKLDKGATQYEADKYARDKAFATSAALTSMFVQSTAKSGSEASSFWKSVLTSPFQEETRDYLVKKSKEDSRLARLNPFIETTVNPITGEKKTEQKSSVQHFIDVMETASLLKKAGEVKEAEEIMIRSFKKTMIGSAQAVGSMLEEYEKNVGQSKADSINSMVEDIMKNASEENKKAVFELNRETLPKLQRLGVSFDVAFNNVFQQLKPRINSNLDFLTNVFKALGNNAGAVASGLGILANILLGSQIKKFYDMFKGKMEAKVTEQREKDLINSYSGKASQLYQRQAYLNEFNEKALSKRARQETAINSTKVRLAELQGNRADLRQAMLDEMSRNITNNKAGIKGKNTDVATKAYQKNEMAIARTQNNLNKHEGLLNFIDRSVVKNQSETAAVTNKLQELTKNYMGAARGTETFKNKITQANKTLQEETKNLTFLNSNLKNLNKTTPNISQVTNSINNLNNAIQKTNNSATIMNGAIRTTRLTNPQSLVGNLGQSPTNRLDTGVDAKFTSKGQMLKQGLTTGLSAIGGGVAGLAMNYAIGASLTALMDSIAFSSMSKGQQGQQKVDALQKLINRQKNTTSYKNTEESMSIGKFFEDPGKSLKSGFTKVFGFLGDLPDIIAGKIDLEDATRAANNMQSDIKASEDKLNKLKKQAFEDTYREEMKQLDEELKREEELKKKAEERTDAAYGKLKAKDKLSKVDLKDLETDSAERIKKTQEYMDRGTSELNLTNLEDKNKLLTQGAEEGMIQLTSLQKNFIDSNIKIQEEGIKQLEEKMKLLETDGKPNEDTKEIWNDYRESVVKARTSIASLKGESIQLDKALKANLLEKISRESGYDKSLNKSKYSILKDELSLKGFSDDSAAMKTLNKRELQDENVIILKEISKKQSELSKYNKDSDEYKKLWVDIKNLQAESKDNLVEIKKSMTNTYTYNAPAGLKPVTYNEFLASSNTSGVKSATFGDTYVTVKFDNVDATSKDKVEQNIIAPIKRAITSRTVANDLRSAMKSNGY